MGWSMSRAYDWSRMEQSGSQVGKILGRIRVGGKNIVIQAIQYGD